jgi:hypothetical protein
MTWLWQDVAGLVQPVRQLDGLAEELADALDCGAKLRDRGAETREGVIDPRAEISRRALELRDLGQRGLVVDRIRPVQREEDQHQMVGRPR